jgi:glycosidase
LTVLGEDRAALGLATVLQATLPGAPCIYYGDEIAMAGDHDPDNRRAYPAEPAAGDQTTRALVRAAMTARHEHVALRRGSVRVLSAAGRALAYLREAEGRRAIVAINAGSAAVSLAVPRPDDRPYRSLELPGLATGSWADGTIALPPEGALVLVEA